MEYQYRTVMSKDTKEARLSFRITNELSDEIDKAVKEFDQIKDRSDFGTKAVSFFISYLKKELTIKETMKDAILALSKHLDADDLPEIKKLKELIDKRTEMQN